MAWLLSVTYVLIVSLLSARRVERAIAGLWAMTKGKQAKKLWGVSGPPPYPIGPGGATSGRTKHQRGIQSPAMTTTKRSKSFGPLSRRLDPHLPEQARFFWG